MRIIFMGTPEFAVPSLEALLRSDDQVVGVISQPDQCLSLFSFGYQNGRHCRAAFLTQIGDRAFQEAVGKCGLDVVCHSGSSRKMKSIGGCWL